MWAKWALGMVCCAALLGCSHDPAKHLQHLAAQLGLHEGEIAGSGFRHTFFFNSAADGSNCCLHVYLDGDGTPWRTIGTPAADPTPRNPLVLRLMAKDASPALYLGRPCYVGQALVPPCDPIYWTHQRYSERVVQSMALALERLIERKQAQEVVLIGYSGGGALAMLLAERIPETRAVVTLAGNLDPDRWASAHGYTPLSGSLNPARRAPLPLQVEQLHFVGEEDETVPPTLVSDVADRQPAARAIVLPGFDHVCCWESVWPSLLSRLGREDVDKRCAAGDSGSPGH